MTKDFLEITVRVFLHEKCFHPIPRLNFFTAPKSVARAPVRFRNYVSAFDPAFSTSTVYPV